ncbi:MAG TPA: hypothetical protein VNY52_06560 [Solirubrobacteraceae bacterium]|jgi:hypothetical protein|nr:hypothetical protein [Solirubrobacteraceae bacterium]
MRLRPLAAVLLLPLLLAGCGGGGTTQVTGHTLRLTLSEYRIVPQRASVPAGALEIVARNGGILTHNVVLQRGSLDSTDRSALAKIHSLLPGASGTVRTGPLAPGHYLLVSTVGNQAALGMAATLIVR